MIEWIAVVFGFVCVVLTVRQNIWCWPAGLIQVLLYIYVFYEAKLYSDVILHIVYVFLQFYGWYHWLYGGTRFHDLPVTSSGWMFAPWLCGVLAGSYLWGFGMERYTDAAIPYGDAFTTVASLAAQYLLARKQLESWLLWIAVDIVAVWIYQEKALYPTAMLYGVFLVLATLGFLAWRKSMQEHRGDAQTRP